MLDNNVQLSFAALHLAASTSPSTPSARAVLYIGTASTTLGARTASRGSRTVRNPHRRVKVVDAIVSHVLNPTNDVGTQTRKS